MLNRDFKDWPNDKKLHFKWGFFLSLAGVVWWPLASLGFIAAIAKEVYDYVSKKGNPEWEDIDATFRGAFNAVILVLIVKSIESILIYNFL